MSGISFKKIRIGIIDLKSHNLFSILQACKNIGYKTSIITSSKSLKNYDVLILPGVGSFKHAMLYLKKTGLDKKIINFSKNNDKIIFGICLGMQLLFESSEEFGNTKGLKIIEGKVKKIKGKNAKVPHIGWNSLVGNKNFPFYNTIKDKKFYFTHSYYCQPKNLKEIMTVTNHGKFSFCSSIKKDKIIGTQFHPEKSGKFGLNIIKKICNLSKI